MLRLGFLFVTITTLEIFTLWNVGKSVGLLFTMGLVFFTGFLGAYLTRQQGLRTLREISETLQRGEMPTSEILSGVMLVVVGAFLLTPGFFTDTLGFALLVPAIRAKVITIIEARIQRWLANNTATMYQTAAGPQGDFSFHSANMSYSVEPPITIDVETKN